MQKEYFFLDPLKFFIIYKPCGFVGVCDNVSGNHQSYVRYQSRGKSDINHVISANWPLNTP